MTDYRAPFAAAAAALQASDSHVCDSCDEDLERNEGAVAVHRTTHATVRVCTPCVQSWMAEHPDHGIIHAGDLVRRLRAKRNVH